MRMISILVTLAVLGYVLYMYLYSSNMTTADGASSKPAEYINQAQQSANTMEKTLQKQQDLMSKDVK